MPKIPSDTYELVHKYADDLVIQRQNLEDALRYQNAEVSEGEGMVTMINKVPSLTGAHASLPYISFARSSINELPNINFNAIPAKDRGKIFRQAINIGYPNQLYINTINYYDVEDLEYAFGGPDGYPYGYINLKLGPMFNLTNATTIRGLFYKNITGHQTVSVDLSEVPVVSAKKLKDLRNVRIPNLFLKLKDVKMEYMDELFKLNIYNDSYINTAYTDESVEIALHVFKNFDFSELKEFKNFFCGKGPTAECMDKFNIIMDAFLHINTHSVQKIEKLFAHNTSPAGGAFTEEQYYDLDFSTLDLNSVQTVNYLILVVPIKSVKTWDSPDGNLKDLSYCFDRNVAVYGSSQEATDVKECRKYIKYIDLSTWNLCNVKNLYNMFSGNTLLEHLSFGYDLGKSYTYTSSNSSSYSVDLSFTNVLTRESVLDIFNKVYDLNISYGVYDEEGNPGTGTLATQKINLHDDVIAKLTPEDIAIATNKGWNVS